MGKKIDLTGQRFGRLVVQSYAGFIKRHSCWNCVCDCGKKIIVRSDGLMLGKTKSCGCYNSDIHSRYQDLTGKRFGRWTVLGKGTKHTRNYMGWYCRCDCGVEKEINGWNLTTGRSKSCGCLSIDVLKENSTKHHLSNSRLYKIYRNMLTRCYYAKHKSYHRYGARGITVCNEWLGENGFEKFAEWAFTNGYNDALTLDRKNTNGNYEPANCRWATYVEQGNNTSSNHFVTYKGETHTIAEWSRIKSINPCTLGYRVAHNWDEDRLFAPPQNNKGG